MADEACSLMGALTKEEREDIISKKIEERKRKNKELEKRHEEIEADKRHALAQNAALTSATSSPSQLPNGLHAQSEGEATQSSAEQRDEWSAANYKTDWPERDASDETPDWHSGGRRGRSDVATSGSWSRGGAHTPPAAIRRSPAVSSSAGSNGGDRHYAAGGGEASPQFPSHDTLKGSQRHGHFGEVPSQAGTHGWPPRNQGHGNGIGTHAPVLADEAHARGHSGGGVAPQFAAYASQSKVSMPAATSSHSPAQETVSPLSQPSPGNPNGPADADSVPRGVISTMVIRGRGRGRGFLIPKKLEKSEELTPIMTYDEIRKKNAAAYEESLQTSTTASSAGASDHRSGGFLADRSRDVQTDFSRTNQDLRQQHPSIAQRNQRNFGGATADLEQVKNKVKETAVESRMGMRRGGEARFGQQRPRQRELEAVMTGRERLQYTAWHEERARVDAERLSRARGSDGWRRAWDSEKERVNGDKSATTEESGQRRTGRQHWSDKSAPLHGNDVGEGQRQGRKGESRGDQQQQVTTPAWPGHGVSQPNSKPQAARVFDPAAVACAHATDARVAEDQKVLKQGLSVGDDAAAVADNSRGSGDAYLPRQQSQGKREGGRGPQPSQNRQRGSSAVTMEAAGLRQVDTAVGTELGGIGNRIKACEHVSSEGSHGGLPAQRGQGGSVKEVGLHEAAQHHKVVPGSDSGQKPQLVPSSRQLSVVTATSTTTDDCAGKDDDDEWEDVDEDGEWQDADEDNDISSENASAAAGEAGVSDQEDREESVHRQQRCAEHTSSTAVDGASAEGLTKASNDSCQQSVSTEDGHKRLLKPTAYMENVVPRDDDNGKDGLVGSDESISSSSSSLRTPVEQKRVLDWAADVEETYGIPDSTDVPLATAGQTF